MVPAMLELALVLGMLVRVEPGAQVSLVVPIQDSAAAEVATGAAADVGGMSPDELVIEAVSVTGPLFSS